MLLRKPLVQLGLSFIGAYCIPLASVKFFYTLSQFLKDLLLFIVPFFIMGCLSTSLKHFNRRAPKVVIFLIIGIFLSTFLATWYAYSVGWFILPHMGLTKAHKIYASLNPYWRIPVTPFLSTDKAVFLGLFLGLLSYKIPSLNSPLQRLYKETSQLFRIFFIPLLPVYVFGFVAKLRYEGLMTWMMKVYSGIFFVTLGAIITYLGILYCFAFRRKIFSALHTMLPACITGFCTSSSATTMPLTVQATAQNLKDPPFAEFIIPATLNFHMTADNINNIICVLSLLLIMQLPFPDLFIFLKFSFVYLVTTLSFSGVPGGVVFIILPIFEKYLGLPAEASALYIAIMVIMDPFMTAGNIMGNGALSKILHKFI